MTLLDTLKFIIEHPLNQAQKFRSIVRYARWQIGSRLIPGKIVHNWIGGAKFFVKTGETGLTGNIYTGLHEFHDMGFLLHYLRNEDLFVDVGANVGSYTILACATVGAAGIAFEPIPSTFKRLENNIRLNQLEEKVKCVNKGVGAESGSIAFTSNSDTTNHALATLERVEDGVNVDVVTLDAELEELLPSLIKIDVEGFETQVLAGGHRTLEKKSLNAVIMELNGSGKHYGYDESKILEVMLGFGFRSYSYNPLTRSLIDLEGKKLGEGNTLFIRDLSDVEQRLKQAAKVSVNGCEF